LRVASSFVEAKMNLADVAGPLPEARELNIRLRNRFRRNARI